MINVGDSISRFVMLERIGRWLATFGVITTVFTMILFAGLGSNQSQVPQVVIISALTLGCVIGGITMVAYASVPYNEAKALVSDAVSKIGEFEGLKEMPFNDYVFRLYDDEGEVRHPARIVEGDAVKDVVLSFTMPTEGFLDVKVYGVADAPLSV